MTVGNRPRLLCGTALGVTFGLAGLTAPSFALAQAALPTDSTAAQKPGGNEVETLTIVGSRIRRDNFNSPSPVEVITHEETTIAGFNSTTDVLQGTAVTGGTAQINNAFGNFVTDGGPGANTIGLRGLGATRTLVLLNGRRVTPAGTRGAVGAPDLNVLPNAIIDHIEILKDGASSIYGSDAVAGVINIITKRNIDYVEMEGQLNVSRSGGKEGRASVVAGHVADRWHISGSFDYYQRDSLSLGQRSWASCNNDYLIDFATGQSQDFIDPKTGKPKCYPTGQPGENGVTINTLGTATMTGVPAVGSTGTRFNRWRPNPLVTTGLVGFEGIGGPNTLNVRDTFDPRMLNESLISPAKTYTVFLQGGYDLHALGNAEAYFEFLGSRRTSSQVGYRQLALDYPAGSPLLPLALRSSIANNPTLLTAPDFEGARAFIGFGNDHSHQTVDDYKVTGGLRGDFFMPRWRYDFTVSYSRSNADYTFESWLTDRLNDSVHVVAAPAGFNPSLVNDNGFTCASNIANPSHGCVPAPSLTADVIGGKLPANWVNWTFVPVTGTTIFSELDSTFNIDGPIFKLPAGDLKGAFGLEYRASRINDTPALASQQADLYNLTAAALTRGSDHVFEAYGELEAPIVVNQPLIHELTLNVSGRFTDYHSYGIGWTYKATGVYAPTNWLSLRATYGTSYRAPALFEQFLGGTTGFLTSSNDPCNDYQAHPGTNLFRNCQAENLTTDPSSASGFQQHSGVTVVTQGGAAQGLKAETSTNLTVGLIFQPKLGPMWGDLSFAVDYYRIEVDNSVARFGAANILRFCYNSSAFRNGGNYCNFVAPRGSGGQLDDLTVFDSSTNIATQRVYGLDYTLRYTRDLGPGSLRINAQVTQYLNQTSKTSPFDPFLDFNGTIGSPKYSGTLDATYTYHKWKLRYGLDWIASMNSYDFLADPQGKIQPGSNRQSASPFIEDTPNYFIHSLAVQYQGDKWEATFGIKNLADRAPPPISTYYYDRVGTAPLYSGFDYVGRVFYVNVSKKF